MTSPSPSVTFVLPNLKHFMLRQVELATLPEDWALSEPPLLKSFCLNHVRMNETTLDALLRNFCHKDLKRLVLLSLVNPGSPTIGTRDQHLVVTEERIMTIAVLSPHLQTIMTNQPSGEEALESLDRVRAAFPHATELAASHLTSVHDPVPAIFKVDQHLTRLEITLSTCWDRHEFPTPAFHAFLCSDKARHLKQLHAPMVKYDAEYLDPQRRTEWTCRGLELLALGFLPKESHDRFSAASSRSMFGFLATMCPRLRYLEIERAHLVASPESGLCFLSRLEELEELVLRTKYFYHWGDYDLTSRPIPPWWASREPTLLQQLKHQDSLGLCRTVSQRDAMGGHFGTLRGKGVLWKNHNHTTTAAITEAETTTTTTKSASTKLSSGACWHKLKKICIQLDEEIEKRNDERNQLRVRAIRKAIPQCQVSIEYVKVK
ncbi:hypothetical protein BGW41_004695 [Actinomortierella wolfii]|nr:hypothetical protein BGW41_004695 [Actinomortierella wolfii]